jgi:hypothetical protein
MDANNYSLVTADRKTHIKVVVVALIAGIAIIGGGIAASWAPPDISTQLEARAPLLKANKPVIWTSSDQITIR